MRFAILGSGGVGGYYGARLARAGHDVTFDRARRAPAAIRARGIADPQPALGDFTVQAPCRGRHRRASARSISSIVAVKAYDNATALPLIGPMLGPRPRS